MKRVLIFNRTVDPIIRICQIIRAYSTAYGMLIGLCGLFTTYAQPTVNQVCAALLISLCFPAGVATLNDWAHHEVDKLTRPNRQYPLTLLKTLAFLLITSTAVTAVWSGWVTSLWLLMSLGWGVLYSQVKSLPLGDNLVRGMVTVSLCLACASISSGWGLSALSWQVAIGLGC
ncbi:MAG: hypothetical protein AAF959_18590 [Cyanobacteria bacterium P01_D01_bin.56]